MESRTCRAAWQHMSALAHGHSVRNYVQLLDMSDYVVETDLFPRAALEAYSAWNLERDLSRDQERYFNAERGGGQGDYRDGMRRKIANVVDCLTRYPKSKRAVITVSNEPMPEHGNDEDAKCLREVHLYLDEDDRLSATAFFRAQAASIFPKNIHFIGSILTEVSERLPSEPALGSLFYVATVLVSDRT